LQFDHYLNRDGEIGKHKEHKSEICKEYYERVKASAKIQRRSDHHRTTIVSISRPSIDSPSVSGHSYRWAPPLQSAIQLTSLIINTPVSYDPLPFLHGGYRHYLRV